MRMEYRSIAVFIPNITDDLVIATGTLSINDFLEKLTRIIKVSKSIVEYPVNFIVCIIEQ